MLFVSHDRTFLRGLSNRVLELHPTTATAARGFTWVGTPNTWWPPDRKPGRARVALPTSPDPWKDIRAATLPAVLRARRKLAGFGFLRVAREE